MIYINDVKSLFFVVEGKYFTVVGIFLVLCYTDYITQIYM